MKNAHKTGRRGFTLAETMVTIGISTSVIVALLSVYITCLRYWRQSVLAVQTTQEANHCLNQMIYGVGSNSGLRAAYAVTNLGTTTDWQFRSSNYSGVAWYDFNTAQQAVLYSNAAGRQVIGTNIVASSATSTVNTIRISLTVLKTDGGYSGSNTVSTFVKLRTASTR
jgi:type II secretory pathway pseudopilin PulG